MTRILSEENNSNNDENNKEEQIELRDLIFDLRENFKQEYESNRDLYLIQDYDKVMNTDDDWYCIRYLRHFKMDLHKALEGMKHNLEWRKQSKIDELDIKCFPKELLLFVPIFVCGKSIDGCPMIYIQGAEYAPSPSGPIKELLRSYLYYVMGSQDDSLGNTGQVHVVLNQTNSSLLHNFELDALKWFVSIRDNWPNRVKSIRVVGLPFVFRPIVKMVVSWLPTEWSDLLCVGTVEELIYSIVDDDNLPWFFNGQLDIGSCKLAPADNRWAKDFDLFQNQENFDRFMRCFYISDDAKNYLIDLQVEHDKKNVMNKSNNVKQLTNNYNNSAVLITNGSPVVAQLSEL